MEGPQEGGTEPSQDGNSLCIGTSSPMFTLHECHPDELELHSVSSVSSSTSISSCSEEPELITGSIVIDMGTRSCRAGFSGHHSPSVEVSTLVGSRMGSEAARSEMVIGEQALLYPDTETVEVMHNGVIINWEAAESLWKHLIKRELRVNPEDHALLLTEPLFTPTSSRENMAEMAFEVLGTPGLFVAPQSVLSVYSHGKITALVLDMGHAATRTMPVLEGRNMARCSTQTDVAGRCLTWYLSTLLEDTGPMFSKGMSHVVEDIKHTCCYVATDFQTECLLPPSFHTMDFTLPNGMNLTISKERFQCPEETVRKSLMQLPEEIIPTMCANILLCGGSSLFKGLEKRLCHELLDRLPPSTTVEVVGSALQRHAAWTGGSILASLRNFQSCWIRRDEYYEVGSCIVHQKCF
ncbi:actin-like protein 9 isoform X2 [Numida meleagris]|uniref:actin-like protein 9 isoform X2 n=1 Tax=Numida meleagris TaxID=8996 RepID=UPI000B3E3974|nr:actin-like protein 9 isoform X2 [Numida meleagris]